MRTGGGSATNGSKTGNETLQLESARLRPSERVTPTPGRLLPWRETICASCGCPFEQAAWRARRLCRECRPWKARG